MKESNMKLITLCTLVLAVESMSFAAADEPNVNTAKPNVLFIFADDMSYETIGAHGVLDIDTPNLDKLARRGATFTHAYNMGAWGGAVCVASRRMLNTGRFVWAAQQADLNQLVSDNQMWSQRMSGAGYRTYLSGKWHVPTSAPAIFDEAEHVRAGMPQQTPAGYNRPKDKADYENGWKPWDTKHGGYWSGGKHWSEVLADDSIGFLEQAAEDDKPFFMYLAFNAPHDPRQAPKGYIDRYPLDRIEVPKNMLPEYPYAEAACGKRLRDEKLMPYPRTEYSVKVNRQEYFALITHMDDQIGKIFQTLENTGQADNTYIVFTADHGLAVGHHGFSGKQNMYDHSVRVPFLVVGPDVKAGSTISSPIYLQDVMPTSLELAGAETDGVDFQSILPLLRGEKAESYSEIYGAYMNRQRMITKDGWKLVQYPTIGVDRLYHLTDDPQEMNDLAGNPELAPKLNDLRAALTALSEELDDPDLKEKRGTEKSNVGRNAAAYQVEEGSDVEQKTTGVWAIEPNPELPNVLILGDSISIAYTLKVREHLKSRANVFRPHIGNGEKAENCQGTTLALQKIDDWLAGQKWDVIHFNWGLHDLKHVRAETGRNSNSFDDPQQASPETYKENLTALVGKLKATGAKLIFATTTPYPDGVKPARLPANAKVYNDIAVKIMSANGIEVNDLYALCEGQLDKLQHPKNVHFNRAGQELQGKAVAAAIDAVLP